MCGNMCDSVLNKQLRLLSISVFYNIDNTGGVYSLFMFSVEANLLFLVILCFSDNRYDVLRHSSVTKIVV